MLGFVLVNGRMYLADLECGMELLTFRVESSRSNLSGLIDQITTEQLA